MAWSMAAEEDFDGVQYDTEHAPSAAQLEAEEIRRECAGPDAVCWEYQAGEQPIRLSFSIKVF